MSLAQRLHTRLGRDPAAPAPMACGACGGEGCPSCDGSGVEACFLCLDVAVGYMGRDPACEHHCDCAEDVEQRPCTDAMHERLKREEWHTFSNHRPWPDAGLELAECPRGCGSTLAIEVPHAD